MITGAQLRAARGLLRWSAKDLAEKSDVAWATIQRAEGADGIPNTLAGNIDKLQKALEEAGIEFIPENGGGVGVRLKKREG